MVATAFVVIVDAIVDVVAEVVPYINCIYALTLIFCNLCFACMTKYISQFIQLQ